MRVLHAAAELYPWVKSGGLADVVAALLPALARHRVETRLVLPGFTALLDAFAELTDVVRLHTPYTAERVRITRARLPQDGRVVYLVDHPGFYDRQGSPYADPTGRDWPDNDRRFGLFGWAVAALARGADPFWRPDLLHGHDWHAGLAFAYLAAAPREGPALRTVFTIHNLAYQGLFPADRFAGLMLPPGFFGVDGIEFFGQLSFLKAGLVYADRLTTVSPTYAREIQTADFGCGLDGVLRARAASLSGILNGVDPEIWEPQKDAALPRRYGIEDAVLGKRRAKAALQRRFALAQRAKAPLFGVVGRLTSQKGLDLLIEALPALVEAGGQLALLGTGERALEADYARAAETWRGRVGVALSYDERLAHLLIAGADLLVVPSRFEPCGLTQLYALRYGTVPLVHRVGGLADTVVDADAVSLAEGRASGLAFAGASAEALAGAVARAVALYAQPEIWRRVMRRGMSLDFSWDAAARRYAALYRELVAAAQPA